MKKLRILIVRNTSFSSQHICLPNQLRLLDWKGFPSKSFPPDFYPEKIAAFNLSCSPLVLEKPFPTFEHLTYMNFSYCQSITQFPNVSGAKNLRELILNRCKRLVKVDVSVGVLPKLVYFSASECTQLRSFLPKIWLPSLEYLSFDNCRRLAQFPEVVTKMDKPLKICMKHTAIRELPHSFVDLVGLDYLDMTSCKELRNLPRGLFMLPNVVTLKIGGCCQLREAFTSFKWSLLMAEYCPHLGTLHFSNASLSDADLLLIVQSFPNLKDLNVSSNYFVSFPACIKESICLTRLDVSCCLMLEDIQELPSSVQKVDARHCNSLTAETSNTLLSQVRKEIYKLEVVMPKTDIPGWLDYHDQGGNPIFWARGKFPIVGLAFVFSRMNCQAVGLHLFINGEQFHVRRQQYHIFNVAEDHVLLCDLRVLFSDEEWERLDARVGHDNDWKSVQLKCETDIIPSQWGVYVYKKETNMDDMRFTSPHPEVSGLRPLQFTEMILIPREEEEEEGSASDSTHGDDLDTTIQVEMASSAEHVNLRGGGSIPHTGTCCSCWSAMSIFRTRHVRLVRSRFQTEYHSSLPCPEESTFRPYYYARYSQVVDDSDTEEYYDSEDGDSNADVEEQMPPSFSESLQTVVDNLKRVVAPRQEKGLGDGEDEDDVYDVEWVADTKILSDEEEEED